MNIIKFSLILILCIGYSIPVMSESLSLPQNDKVNRKLAQLCMSNDNATIEYATELLKTDSTNGTHYSFRCLAYIRKGLFNQALSDCNNAIKYSPDWYAGYFGRATINANLNQLENSVEDRP